MDKNRHAILLLYLTVLVATGSVWISNLPFTENVSFRDKIINNFRILKEYGCQTSVETCSKLCYEVYLCLSFFFNDDCNICQLHSVRFEDSAVGLSNTGWKYYTVDKTGIKPMDCEDAFLMGNTTNGVYEIYRNGTSYDVYCDMNRNGWTVFQRRLDGATDFNRNWSSYVTGFGNMSHEFSLGLDKIHELTSSGSYGLRIDIEDHDGVWKYAIYSIFRLGDALENYTLKYDGYLGTAGDSLHYSKGFGLHWHGYNNSLKTTEMKIRRM